MTVIARSTFRGSARSTAARKCGTDFAVHRSMLSGSSVRSLVDSSSRTRMLGPRARWGTLCRSGSFGSHLFAFWAIGHKEKHQAQALTGGSPDLIVKPTGQRNEENGPCDLTARFISEYRTFPAGAHDDLLDAVSWHIDLEPTRPMIVSREDTEPQVYWDSWRCRRCSRRPCVQRSHIRSRFVVG
jgi:hypothetical protein